jgi:hypothetical protein
MARRLSQKARTMPEDRPCSSCGADLPTDASSALCPRCSPHSGVDPAIPADQAGPAGTTVLPMPLREKPGDKIGRYKLLQEIGTGGFGVVYMAEQEEPVRRRVALKIIKLGMDTKEVIARFEAERQALALMSLAEAQMNSLPHDERKPLVSGSPASYDDLICWMAYKEAKTMLKDSTAKP